jgi:hypothetical protein
VGDLRRWDEGRTFQESRQEGERFPWDCKISVRCDWQKTGVLRLHWENGGPVHMLSLLRIRVNTIGIRTSDSP